MKAKASIKKRCRHCYIVKRNKKTLGRNGTVKFRPTYYVYCKANPKHKQKQA